MPLEPSFFAIAVLKSANRRSSVTPAGRPAPSSVTENVTVRAGQSTSHATTMADAPGPAYFTAFVSSFTMICRTRTPSSSSCVRKVGG